MSTNQNKGESNDDFDAAHSCSFCGVIEGVKLCCARCKLAFYCNQECQKKDWKQHKEDCGVATRLAETSPALQLIDERLANDSHLVKNLLALGVSLLDLQIRPEAYKTHYVRLEWSNRAVPGAPQPLYLEKYRVLPMSQATPGFLKDVKNVKSMSQPQIMFDFMLFGSEKFLDGPYNYSLNIPLPPREFIATLCSIEPARERSQSIARDIRKILAKPPIEGLFA